MRRRCFLLAAFCAFLFAPAAAGQTADPPPTIFAAASTTDAVTEIAAAYAAVSGVSIRPVFAASSTLARQITQSAPADLYLSANETWVEHLIGEGMIEEQSRTDLLTNRLVLIAPADSPLQLKLSTKTDLKAALGEGRLAVGDPAHVPAGIYARQALESLGLWTQVAGKLAQSGNVRAALALVERGEVPAGIVYATDAAISPKVRVIDSFPAQATPAISYPLAIVHGHDRPAVRKFYDYLLSPAAAAIFRKHGFTAAGGAS